MRREIFVGSVGIGGDHPISIQSMTNTDTADEKATLDQIRRLAAAGCDIVRVAVPEARVLEAFKRIVSGSPLPVIADVHFDAELAVQAIVAGAQGLRINPGNIGARSRLEPVIREAEARKIPIRIGVNAGSMEKRHREGSAPRHERLVHSLMDHVHFFEDRGFSRIKVSVKSSSVRETVDANRLVHGACPYPIHLGVTEAGSGPEGLIKSAVGIGSLLLDGIGNTIRVSLTADPTEEVRAARAILTSIGVNSGTIDVISCPTCARTSVDLIPMVEEVKERLKSVRTATSFTVAIMGCEVNGPGEAREADLGLAFSRSRGFIFSHGRLLEKVSSDQAVDRLVEKALEMVGCCAPPL